METSPSRQLNYPIEPYKLMYAGVKDQSNHVPPVPYRWMDPDNLRQIVHDPTVEPKGTIVIDERSNYLYLILGDRKALRYGIAFGDRYKRWSGPCHIRRRERWPDWQPRTKFDRLEGHVAQHKPGNGHDAKAPYGPRALYIYQGRTDTELVIHGTWRWDVIGGPAPQGSILMLNQDVMDLYHRTHTGTRVVIV
ncbi:MAG: L,D-transpeptidase [Alphaproteobacteria bacterium]|nr:L,D-transpeptidase [Alphaproteobacteria bacterium]